jgi:hypothetical protein
MDVNLRHGRAKIAGEIGNFWGSELLAFGVSEKG